MAFEKFVALALAVPLMACGGENPRVEETTAELDEAVCQDTGFAITSPAFSEGEAIPDAYTCDGKEFGAGVSPALSWAKGKKPRGVKSYAVVFKDLSLTEAEPVDYRGYHWAIWDIRTHNLPEAIESAEFVSNPPHARQWSRYSPYGYLGPCPNWDPNVPARTDTYSFTLYAFDQQILDLPPVDAALPNYVRVLDEYFASVAIGLTELRGTSDATPSSAPVPPGPPPPPAPRP